MLYNVEKGKQGGKAVVAKERQMRICDLLTAENAVRIADLAEMFQVTAETIRRDLMALEKAGLLQRTHGGALSLARMAHIKDYTQRQGETQEQKRALAACAAAHIQEEDTVLIDAGTTALALARLLPGRFRRLTVATYSLDVAQALKDAPGIDMILCGGYYLGAENACWGDFALDTLRRLHADKAFLCPSCVSLAGGITDYLYELLPLQRAYLQGADRVFILADSSKFEKTARLQITPLAADYPLITDDSLPEEIFTLYQEKGLQIIRGRAQ